eukprot:gene35035-42431_t
MLHLLSHRVSSFKSVCVVGLAKRRLQTTIKQTLSSENRVSTLVNLLDDSSIKEKYAQTPNPDPFLFPKLLLEHFRQVNPPPKAFVTKLLEWGIEQHKDLPNVLKLSRGDKEIMTVCGDTHGQYHDFCRIFGDKVAGFPSSTNRFLFNGDMVDRGFMGLEIVLMLLTLKQCDENCIYMLRGNHETAAMYSDYGFLWEIQAKYDEETFNLCQQLFANLPIAATLDDKVFIAHGGLGTDVVTKNVDDIDAVERRLLDVDVDDGILTELLWSDPRDRFSNFSARGIGVHYNASLTNAFLKKNNLALMLRSHECENEGYKWWHNGRTLTVFSAPNYCGMQRNKGAVVRFGDDLDEAFDHNAAFGDTVGLPRPPRFKIVQFTEERNSELNYRFAQRKVQQMMTGRWKHSA